MIRTEKLTKIFRTEEVETLALRDVDIHVEDGEFVAVMGPSGCGKSTLLNILGLLDNPTGGQYFFDGKEVGHLKESQRTQLRKGNIGFVFQSFNLIDELTCSKTWSFPSPTSDPISTTQGDGEGGTETDEYRPSPKAFPATAFRRNTTRGYRARQWWQIRNSFWPTNPRETSTPKRSR